MWKRLIGAGIALSVLVLAQPLFGQGFHSRPYEAQLKTDPSVGNVQGVQRYGRNLRTDPDRGEGYSYHVYPVQPGADASLAALVAQAANQQRVNTQDLAEQLAREQASQGNSAQAVNDGSAGLIQAPVGDIRDQDGNPGATGSSRIETQDYARAIMAAQALGLPTAGFRGTEWTPGYEPFDATRGLRNFSMPPNNLDVLTDPRLYRAALTAQAIGFDNTNIAELVTLYQQPLIQVKLRVVEVVRNDALQANSVLEYVSRGTGDPSLTSGSPLNSMPSAHENLRGLTRMGINGLVSNSTTGAGTLINLTSEHINAALSVLATEFQSDIVTAPEVVTLNGQNVEFVSGAKVPFQLGQNVIQGTNNNIQQFFFKNVGAYVSVTPRIVNWGYFGEGNGQADIVANQIADWNGLAALLVDETKFNIDLSAASLGDLQQYTRNKRPVPIAIQDDMLRALNGFTREDLFGRPMQAAGEVVFEGGIAGLREVMHPGAFRECNACDWKPDDCTIDMSLVVRLSDKGTDTVTLNPTDPDASSVSVNFEQNVRAIANTIQIQSGEGVVMAGLIGTRESESLQKIPFLGELPYVGPLFRSKETLRQKTEVLIFLEAQVLDPVAAVARSQSAEDFRLSRDYVDGPLLDNPLEIGMQRVGFGSYLPPARHHECLYWENVSRKRRKMATHADDLLR